MEIIAGAIRDIFLRHDAHRSYGVALLHKHFPIQPTERLVDIRNVSSPWETGDTTSATVVKYEGRIVPRSLRFVGEHVQPYEFEYSAREPTAAANDVFLQHLSGFIHSHRLENILGLRLLESRDPEVSVEVTEGTSNIMLPRGAVDAKQLIPAMWIFGKDEDDRCNCREYCLRDRGGHTSQEHGCG